MKDKVRGASKRPRPLTPRTQQKHLKLQDFFRSTNWAEWWEEFYRAIKANGLPKYRNTYEFAMEKGKTGDEIAFIKWYLGPVQLTGNEEVIYPWCSGGPQDWYLKRSTGGWFSQNNLKKFSREITRRMNALECLREAGNGITLNSLVRAEALAEELDRSFNGQMFLEGATFKQNVQRTRSYIELHNMVLEMKGRAQELYAKAHGVNFSDMAGLTQLMSSATEGGSRHTQALKQLVEMALMKSGSMGLALPPGAVEVIRDIPDDNDPKGYKQ